MNSALGLTRIFRILIESQSQDGHRKEIGDMSSKNIKGKVICETGS